MNSFKAAWLDYFRNLVNFTAPITEEAYKNQLWVGRLTILPFILLMFGLTMTSDLNSNGFLFFLVTVILVAIVSYPTEMRMFHMRGKSPLLYQVTHLIFFIAILGYYIYAVMTHQQLTLLAIMLAYLIPSFTTLGNYYFK
ncbi:hypothetical protein [Macrococcus equipercicus]|uniref:Uncharacterized protein n=1 Tax=Macrococcus equipercicus TaxID=69967 RepID=A0A9Q9BM90_9STAP|nr:hypothetical protein [Macrococcus equipercicus]UTH13125.1 hypothetical protein KFV11_07560 [Macrococcus equipercicus]